MALKSLLLLVALASSAIAQTTTTAMPDPSSTMMVMPSTQTPMETPTPGPLFVNVSADEVQRDHFFCLGTGSTRRDYLTTPDGNLMDSTWPYRWGLWIQYPVLSYLDTMRKRHLLYVITRMINSDPNVVVNNLFDNICIAEVEQYGVSTYRESVFVKLYVNNTMGGTTVENIDRAFRNQYNRDSTYVVPFLGRLAINVTAMEPSMGPRLSERTVNDSVHPGCDSESCPEGDPTLLAVVIGTYVGRGYYGTYSRDEPPEEVTVETLERLERGERITGLEDSRYYSLEPFADNPRPINYGLEAGDIVFAVFGSIFLTILVGAIILGYVIHPFFLA